VVSTLGAALVGIALWAAVLAIQEIHAQEMFDLSERARILEEAPADATTT
jgi:hypothetical protein